MVDVCHSKCIPSTYQEPELNKGESVCIDRCVSKYFEVNMKVGAKLSQRNQ
jgi:import inner membrane translocase subunit TIM10